MSEEKDEILFDIIERAKKGIEKFCTDWVIKGIIQSENQIRFSENKIDINKNWDDLRVNLFLSKNRRTAEISINDMSHGIVENTLNYCEKLLNAAHINRNYKRLPEGPFKYDIAFKAKYSTIK